MEISDLSPKLYSPELHEGKRACSVGWLGCSVPTRGRLELNLFEAIRHYRKKNYLEDGLLGSHTCEMCGTAEGHGEFIVEWGGMRYVLPTLVLHYLENHHYLPPKEFLAALAASWSRDREETG